MLLLAVINGILCLSGIFVIGLLERKALQRLHFRNTAVIKILFVIDTGVKAVAWVFITYCGHKDSLSKVDLFFLFLLPNMGIIDLLIPPFLLTSVSWVSRDIMTTEQKMMFATIPSCVTFLFNIVLSLLIALLPQHFVIYYFSFVGYTCCAGFSLSTVIYWSLYKAIQISNKIRSLSASLQMWKQPLIIVGISWLTLVS